MEDVLRVYARPYDPRRPVVCLDERPVVLHASTRTASPMKPGKSARTDYEYARHGTANAFCIVEPLTGRRLTHATMRRGYRDFAKALARISRRYSTATKIHLVVDNLSTHEEKACLVTYGERRGRALWRRFTLHYTPKHGSWLNAAEMEVSLLARQCLGHRRIAVFTELRREVAIWSRQTDRRRRPIAWKFRVKDARRVFRYDGITTSRSED